MSSTNQRRATQQVEEPFVYTPDQLAVLVEHASQLERLLILTGVNCAFGPSELGHLRTSHLRVSSQSQSTDGFTKDSQTESFVWFIKSRTGSYGEWILWPETANALRWGVQRAGRLGSQFLACGDNDISLRQPMTGRPTRLFVHMWHRLTRRVHREHPSFPRADIGVLKNVLPTAIRRHYTDDLASTALMYRTCLLYTSDAADE